jgi:AcrR family transcriptional regulator
MEGKAKSREVSTSGGPRSVSGAPKVSGGRTNWNPPPKPGDKVLAAALKLFDSVGYSATTIEDVRLQSEVSIGSIYHRFGSKEGIAGALYVQSLRDYQRGLVRLLLESDGAEQGVRGAVGHHLRWVDGNRARARFLMRRRETELVQVNRRDVELLNRELFSQLEDWYRPLVAAGELRELPLPLLYAIWFGPAQELARHALESSKPPRLLDAEPALADAAWAALRSTS